MNDILQRAIAVRDELTAAIERAQTKPADEWPRVGDTVWVLQANGIARWGYGGRDDDRALLARGAIYRTQAEAERADQRRIVEAELRRMAREAGPIISPWYELRKGATCWIVLTMSHLSGMPRFPTRAAAEAAISAITPERLDLLLDEGE